MSRLIKVLAQPVPLYFVGALLLGGTVGIVLLLGVIVYAERGGPSPTIAAIGNGALAVGAETFDSLRAVYRSTQQLAGGANAEVVEPLTFDLAPALEPAPAPNVAIAGPSVRGDPTRSPGWRLVTGTFAIDGELQHSVLALDSELVIRHVWRLHERGVPGEVRDRFFKFPHGFEVLPDGSVIFAFDGGASLRRFDVCSREIWTHAGKFHHAVTLTNDGETVWTLRNPDPEEAPRVDSFVTEVSVADGRTMREFSLLDVAAANPGLDIFGVRHIDSPRAREPRWADDPFHVNDADPLPSSLAAAFSGIGAGDVMLSLRSLNLIAAVDPNTLEVIWYRSGFVRRQHDPDWTPDGRVVVYDNNMNRRPSRIVAIDPATFAVETLVDGAAHRFYSHARGKHQLLPDGSLLVSSPLQGRVIEVAPNGDVVFELVNFLDDAHNRVVLVSEARWLPPDWFDFEAFPDCETEDTIATRREE